MNKGEYAECLESLSLRQTSCQAIHSNRKSLINKRLVALLAVLALCAHQERGAAGSAVRASSARALGDAPDRRREPDSRTPAGARHHAAYRDISILAYQGVDHDSFDSCIFGR